MVPEILIEVSGKMTAEETTEIEEDVEAAQLAPPAALPEVIDDLLPG